MKRKVPALLVIALLVVFLYLLYGMILSSENELTGGRNLDHKSSARAKLAIRPEIVDGVTEVTSAMQTRRENFGEAAPVPPPNPLHISASFPLDPLAVVNQTIDSAKQGNASAQFKLYETFSECAKGPQTEEGVREVQQATLDKAFIAQQTWIFEHCMKLLAAYPSPATDADKWLSLAVLNGDPNAILSQSVSSYPSNEVSKDLIVDALLTNNPTAFMSLSLKIQTGAESEIPRVLVWQSISCELMPSCDQSALFEASAMRFQEQTLEAIKTKAAEINAVVRSKDRAALTELVSDYID